MWRMVLNSIVGVVALIVAVGLFGCDGLVNSPQAPEDVPFETLDSRVFFVEHNDTFVIEDQEEWRAFIEKYMHDRADSSLVPAVDFARYDIAAISWGNRIVCSFEIEAVEAVRAYTDSVVVDVGPLPDPGTCTNNFEPLQIIKFEEKRGPVRFAGEVPVDVRDVPVEELILGRWEWDRTINPSADAVTTPDSAYSFTETLEFLPNGEVRRYVADTLNEVVSYRFGDSLQRTGRPALVLDERRYRYLWIDRQFLMFEPETFMEDPIYVYKRTP